MGDEADALSEQLEDGSTWYSDRHGNERWGHKPRRSKSRKAKRGSSHTTGSHHFPSTDAEAKALIKRLGHFEWETRKASGYYSSTPYTLVATIDGTKHSIRLPGRFGTTLIWLKGQLEEKKA